MGAPLRLPAALLSGRMLASQVSLDCCVTFVPKVHGLFDGCTYKCVEFKRIEN